jgi:hypothetical protein
VYVALSRATSLEGLILTSNVNDRFLGAHFELKQWEENNYKENSLPSLFENARQSFMKHELFNAFSFDHYRQNIQLIKKELEENGSISEAGKWLNALSNKQHEINSTAIKFKQTLHLLWNENTDVASNDKLNKRVRDAAVYFSAQLIDLQSLFTDHPIKVTARKISRKIDKILQELSEHILHSMTKINLCMNGFHFNELAGWKKALPQHSFKIKSTYFSTQKNNSSSEEFSDLFYIIADYRKEIAEKRGLPPFLIFGNDAIKSCCELLPGDKESLFAVSGFKKKKINEYGEDILSIIKEYCEENNIQVNYIHEKEQRQRAMERSFTVSETVKHTIDLFIAGKNISEISDDRKLASSTIEGHLAIGIKNRMVDIEKILHKQEIESLAIFFSDNSLELKNAKEKSGPEISYGKLKMVQAWLMAEKENSKV